MHEATMPASVVDDDDPECCGQTEAQRKEEEFWSRIPEGIEVRNIPGAPSKLTRESGKWVFVNPRDPV